MVWVDGGYNVGYAGKNSLLFMSNHQPVSTMVAKKKTVMAPVNSRAAELSAGIGYVISAAKPDRREGWGYEGREVDRALMMCEDKLLRINQIFGCQSDI